MPLSNKVPSFTALNIPIGMATKRRIHKDKIMATIIFMVEDSSDEEKRKRRIKLLHNIVSVYKFYDNTLNDSIKKSGSSSEYVYKK